MANNTYRLRYLPLFYTDLEEKVTYIVVKLQNPQAANDLLDAKVVFEVIVLIERSPFELLFGVLGHNFSFSLTLKAGYELQGLPNNVFFRLCDILNLKAGKEGLTSSKFLQYVAKKIPTTYSGKKIQPHEVAIYKQRDVAEEDKIYFCGWRFYLDSDRDARNFDKTRKWLGGDAYNFCKKNNISSCWTDKDIKRKDYYTPQEYLSKHK